ncbi:MAG: hypothetical protein KKB81_01525 [Candidatus Margulisbacteria bacterium]|nr:hypothetical protein [Candidatus Margulisiibacteriota bacterium]MBU1021595.1 hypothetical protein [Candidatus Margulisiibacteriota bacterium]MBU1728746.1 hypothetical protein [Candidatus Margulisiibacteriota bacterium]MBU1955712.1 hypothetical protein [Candidatus Margulisiibacteriota bacterium]
MTWPKLIKSPLTQKQIKELTESFIEDMIKVAIDIKEEKIAAGCALHADAEQVLLKHGSQQKNVWGANYFPFKKRGERLEYSALMNIRPRQNNVSQLIQNKSIREKVKSVMEHYFEL